MKKATGKNRKDNVPSEGVGPENPFDSIFMIEELEAYQGAPLNKDGKFPTFEEFVTRQIKTKKKSPFSYKQCAWIITTNGEATQYEHKDYQVLADKYKLASGVKLYGTVKIIRAIILHFNDVKNPKKVAKPLKGKASCIKEDLLEAEDHFKNSKEIKNQEKIKNYIQEIDIILEL